MSNPAPSVEIMAPVGSPGALAAALQGGAHSVYFGVGKLNMRARSAHAFEVADMHTMAQSCRQQGVKTYLTLNTVLFDEELAEMRRILDEAQKAGISAVIASDMAVMEYARSLGVEVHVSTQCNITNLEAVRFFARYADVMVTARELSLAQVHGIAQGIQKEQIKGPGGRLVQLELFVHGAMCMAVSGKCALSLDLMNYSANRGACLQPCRRSYLVTDREEGFAMEVDSPYILSPKDLCTIGFIDKIMAAGVSVFKIEGRGRGPDYVRTVTRCYREAAEAVQQGSYSKEKVEAWTRELAGVFNRGFWDGYYLGRSMAEWAKRYGSQSTRQKQYIGKVTHYFSRLGVAEIRLETSGLSLGENLMLTGPATGVLECPVEEIRLDEQVVSKARKGDLCSIPLPAKARPNDKVFRITTRPDPF